MGTLSWIIRAGLKCNHLCPYKREAEGDLTGGQRTDRGGSEAAPRAADSRASGRSAALSTPSSQPREPISDF